MANIRTLQAARGTEHENTTVEGSIASHTFAAGSLTPGKIFDISGAMIVVDNNSTDTLTLRLRFGTSTTVTSNTACGASNAVDVADNDFAAISAKLHVVSSTRAVLSGWISGADAANAEACYPIMQVLTIAAETAYYLDWTADWSVAHADNECAAESFAVIEIA